MPTRRGRITKIEKMSYTSAYVTQGIKSSEQSHYDNSYKYKGSNGTYAHGHNTEYSIEMYITIYGNRGETDIKCKIDIRDLILKINNLQRISSKKMDHIQKMNVGKKIDLGLKDGRIHLVPGQLTL